MNGSPWTRPEIDYLVQTVEQGGDTLALSAELGRTHEAVIAKAKRLGMSVAHGCSASMASTGTG